MNLEQRALQTWTLLVCAAREQKTYFYEDVGEVIGVPAFGLAPILDPIMRLCRQRGWPPLTVLVVNKGTGDPGDGLPLDDGVPKERARVYCFDWFKLEPPETSDFRAAMKAE